MRILAVDLGSTNTKGFLLDGPRILAERSLPAPPNIADGSRYELDPETIFRQVLSLLEELHNDTCAGLLLSTQMHGCLLTDGSFRPLTNYISWRDTLSVPLMDEIRAVLGEQAAAPSGVPLKPNLALCSLLARTRGGESLPSGALFHTLGGYILGRLTGEHVCHGTNAAPTGLAEVRGGGWNYPLIEKAGLGGLRFPRIETGLRPVGVWRSLPVYPDLGDQQAGVYRQDALADGCLYISFGTAGLLGALTETWGDGPYENRPWVEEGLYLRTVSGLPGGHLLAALHGEILDRYPALTPAEAWDIINRTPADACEEIEKSFTLPAFENIARQYADAARKLELPLRTVVFSGGGAAKAPGLRTTIARGLGLRELTPPPDTIGFRAIVRTLEETQHYGIESQTAKR